MATAPTTLIRLATTAGLLTLVVSSAATAQPRGAACSTQNYILLSYPAAPDSRMAERAITDLTQQIASLISRSTLCVYDRKYSDQYLKDSGFDPARPLSPIDAKTLATQARADEFLLWEVAPGKAPGSFQYNGTLYLARDIYLRDKIPTPEEGANMSQAAKWFVEKIKDVRKQLEHEKKCYTTGSAGNYAEAEAAARAGIAAYPEATIARMCLASVLRAAKKPPAEVTAVVDEILKRDPNNTTALGIALNAYFDAGNQDKYAELGTRFIQIDPANPSVETIIDNLALWKKTEAALRLIQQVLREDPENNKLINTEFRLIYAAGQWKDAAQRGERLQRLDSTVVDTLFVLRMVSAYENDSQPAKVLEWLAKGVAKFPSNITFAQGYAQKLNAAGQVTQAIAAYERVIRIAPTNSKDIRLRIANLYNGMGQTDSVLVWLQRADQAGDDKEIIAGVAVSIANAALRRADTTKAIADYEVARGLAIKADSIRPTTNGTFIWGIADYRISSGLVQQYTANNNTAPWPCADAKKALDSMISAQQRVLAGARAFPDIAARILDQLNNPQFREYLEGVNRSCKQSSH